MTIQPELADAEQPKLEPFIYKESEGKGLYP